MWDSLWTGGTVATMRGDGLGLIEAGAVAARDGRIAWVGPAAALPEPAGTLARAVHDTTGTLVTPGLVDCLTYLLFGGDRIGEFRQALGGATRGDVPLDVENRERCAVGGHYAACWV
jgi:imidazolonepropionase